MEEPNINDLAENPNVNDIQQNLLNNPENQNQQNILIINKDFFVPFTSLSFGFGIYNQYYSIYRNNPRKTNIFYFFQSFLFPNLDYSQLSFIISVINIIIFIITLFFGIEKTNERDLFTIKYSVLMKFGAFHPKSIIENKLNIIRALTANFLHLNLKHLLYDIISLCIFPSLFEIFINKHQFLIIYIVGGFITYLLTGNTSIIRNNFSVGANYSIFSVIGAFYSYLAFNWSELNRNIGLLGKIYILYFMIIYTFIASIFFLGNSFINSEFQFASSLFGFLFFSVFIKPIKDSKYKIIGRIFCFIITCYIIYSSISFFF